MLSPFLDPKDIAKTHYDALQQYLAADIAKLPAISRSTAGQKLTKLTSQQFQELSTDVYEELLRRRVNPAENEVPWLVARDEFQAKRNQARQKLSTLPTARFKDLSSDVYFELSRRYPGFEETIGPKSAPSTDTPVVPPPSLDPKVTARTHYNELQQYLVAYLVKAPPNSRSNARLKLTKLSNDQFQELSTDVYDELLRRKRNTLGDEVPWLGVVDGFHPKRNEARQKLSTLPNARFEDLSSDVHFELARRNPELKEHQEFCQSLISTYSTSLF